MSSACKVWSRHGLRHTALTWMADAGVELHILQRGRRDPTKGQGSQVQVLSARHRQPDCTSPPGTGALDGATQAFRESSPVWWGISDGTANFGPIWAQRRDIYNTDYSVASWQGTAQAYARGLDRADETPQRRTG